MNPRRAFLKRVIKAACVAPFLRVPTRGATTFSSGRAHYQGTVPVTAAPLTMACWFNVENITQAFMLMSIGDFDANHYFYMEANGAVTGDPLQVGANAGGTIATANSTSGYSASTWQHACGVCSSSTSRTIYLNGGNSATSTASRVPTNLDYIALGDLRSSSAWFDVKSKTLAECAIWNVALNADEVAALAKGYRPSLIRPSALVFYAPLVREIRDLRGGLSLTVSGNTTAVHPRRIG